MATAVVLGGGVSGLAAAYYLQRQVSRFSKIILLEASHRLGGWVSTTRFPDGAIYEHGPHSLRATGKSGQHTLTLLHELGLESEILPVTQTHHGAQNRYIFYKNQLHSLPTSLSGIFKKSSLLSQPLVWNLIRDLVSKRAPTDDDETVHSFISRRLGTEVADVLMSSMCRGIFAGDVHKLSVRACFPDLYQLEQDHRSLVLGSLFGGKSPANTCPLVKKSRQEKWALYSLKQGLEQLTETLTQVLHQNPKCELRLQTPCTGLQLDSRKATVQTENDCIKADHVFSTIFAQCLSPLLSDSHKDLKHPLAQISGADIIVVHLEFDGQVLPHQGFGHLVPHIEHTYFLGVIYDSSIFPSQDCQSSPSTRLTVMMGGSWFDQLLDICPEMSEESLTDLAIKFVSEQLGISAPLRRSQVKLQKNCLPQYQLGHKDRLSQMQNYIASCQLPLSLLGSSYKGPSVNDCILNSRLVVDSLMSP